MKDRKSQLADHYCVCVQVPCEYSSRTHYYLDQDFGGDEAKAERRLMNLVDAGFSAWIEPFYGDIRQLDIRRYNLVTRPQEIEG
jgi:hypothetical protein